MTPARLVAATVIGALLVWALLGVERPADPEAAALPSIARAADPGAVPAPIPDEPSATASAPVPAADAPAIHVERLEKIEQPPGPLHATYDALALSANAGDPKAALQLGLGLYRCRRAVRSQAELTAAIDRIRSRPPRVYYFGNERREIPHDERIESLQQGFEYCAGISDDVVNQYFDWLVLGAELGLLQAQLAAAVTPHPEGFGPIPTDEPGIARMNDLRATAMKWTHAAVAGGSVDAMRWLAMRYDKGVLIKHDRVRAYAYMSAAARARAAAGEQAVMGAAYVEMLARELNTAQLHEAQRLADLYLADPACCKL